MKWKICSLQVLHSLSGNSKNLFRHLCPKKVILFLCSCAVNFLKINLQSIKNMTGQHFRMKHDWFLWKLSILSKEETFCHSKKSYNSKKSFILPSITFCLDIQLFVFVHDSVYNNNSLNSQTVTKQELPKYQAEQIPRTKMIRLKRTSTRSSLLKRSL